MPTGDWDYFVGTSAGKVCDYKDTNYSDDGTAITCQWVSKILDFSDQYPEDIDKFYTIYRVALLFGIVNVNPSITISVDNDLDGIYEYSDTQTLDSAYERKRNFWVVATGDYFRIKVSHSATTRDIEWNGIEIEFDPRGQRFN
jgi:hypothetical protein